MKNLLLTAFWTILFFPLLSQNYNLNQGTGILVNISYAGQVPGGDLFDRFGGNFNIGGGVEMMTGKGNWIIGLEGGYIFGSEVKTDVLANLKTSSGFIIANDRNFATIQMRERGFYIGGLIGKLIPISEVNKRSGLRVTVGAGILQHNIRIQDDPSRTITQLTGEYRKGYDRLSNGLAFNEFIGYQFLGRNKRMNFYAGFEFTQGFTQSRRDFNYDTRSVDTEKRLDLLFGLRIGWVLPFYIAQDNKEIYY